MTVCHTSTVALQVNAGSMAPITAIQFGAHRVLDKMVTTATGKPLEGLNSIAVATGVPALTTACCVQCFGMHAIPKSQHAWCCPLSPSSVHRCTAAQWRCMAGRPKHLRDHRLEARRPRSGADAGAGAVSASVGCPAELVMIQQQRTGRPLAQEFSSILRERGILRFYRGLVRPVC